MECENEFNDCEQSIELAHEKIYTARQHNPGSQPKFHILFMFSCKPFLHNWSLTEQHSRNPQFDRYVDMPKIDSFTIFSLHEFILQEQARKTIKDHLDHWPVNEDWRKTFIDNIMSKARDAIIKMPSRHNTVLLEFKVTAIHKHVFIEWDAVERMINMVDEEEEDDDDDDDDYDDDDGDDDDDDEDGEDGEDWMALDGDSHMIPTLDSCIDSIETKKIETDDIITCAICLEELSSEGVLLGCLHIFHQDCIKTWLRISHFCPICRFEMPTAS